MAKDMSLVSSHALLRKLFICLSVKQLRHVRHAAKQYVTINLRNELQFKFSKLRKVGDLRSKHVQRMQSVTMRLNKFETCQCTHLATNILLDDNTTNSVQNADIAVISTPSVSVNASVAACIGIHCDAWEWGGGGDRFPSVTMYANTTLPLGVGRRLIGSKSSIV